jgi:protein TonB
VVVVLLHVLIGWALASGLARKAVEIVRKPIEARLIQEEIAPPPPPPPPPQVERIKDTPKVQAPPPPPYVPPPEVATAAPAPVIQAVQSEVPKAPPAIEPPAPPAPPPPEPKPAVVKQEISVACPGYQAVLAQALEEAIERIGLPGTVNTLIKIRGSQVVEVLPQSGPKEYFKYVVAAVKRMRCSAGGADEVQVTLPVIFSR